MKERPEAGRDYRDEFYAAYSTATDVVHADERTAWRQFESRWQQWLPNDRSVPMLDIGCGSGVFVRFLRSCGFANVTGVDRSVSETTRAHASGTGGVMCDDAVSFLGAHRDAYGLVAALNVFEHLRKAEVLDLLRALRRALRPGGRVLIVTPNGLSPFGGATRYWDFSHELSFTPASWRQLARISGFREPIFEEYGPIAHSAAGVVRCALWRIVALAIEAVAWIEVGGPRDPSRVYTADMKVILTK